MSINYILDDEHNAVPCDDLMQWAVWFQDINNRRVAYTDLPGGGYVSTVFLGIDHNFRGGTPLLYETMVFKTGSEHDELQERCSTWAQAEAMHAEVLRVVWPRRQEAPPDGR
jgi:hypothetical protein